MKGYRYPGASWRVVSNVTGIAEAEPVQLLSTATYLLYITPTSIADTDY